MRKAFIGILSLAIVLVISGCGNKDASDATIIGGADGPTSIFLSSKADGSVSEDYHEDDDPNGQSVAIPGTWQTVSMVYEADGTMYPEYYVQFTDAYINYGHMINGTFTLDHSDSIFLFENNESGAYKVQAKSANGVQYTYQTSENDTDILEYYETWNEEEYPEMYRGGASLSRCDL